MQTGLKSEENKFAEVVAKMKEDKEMQLREKELALQDRQFLEKQLYEKETVIKETSAHNHAEVVEVLKAELALLREQVCQQPTQVYPYSICPKLS